MRPRLTCDICGFKSTSDIVLKQHKSLNHKTSQKTKKPNTTVTKRKKCEFCEKLFNKEETLKNHVKKFHKEKLIMNTNEVQP